MKTISDHPLAIGAMLARRERYLERRKARRRVVGLLASIAAIISIAAVLSAGAWFCFYASIYGTARALHFFLTFGR